MRVEWESCGAGRTIQMERALSVDERRNRSGHGSTTGLVGLTEKEHPRLAMGAADSWHGASLGTSSESQFTAGLRRPAEHPTISGTSRYGTVSRPASGNG